ncbi:unnamed protein product, partial [Sphenostylis stenocarpa]
QERQLSENINHEKVLSNSTGQQNSKNDTKNENGSQELKYYGRGRGKNYGKQCSFCD